MEPDTYIRPEPVFTLASMADSETLLQLMREFYHHEQLQFDPQVADSTLKLLFDHPAYGCIYLIGVNLAIAGYLVLTFGFSLEYGGRDALIDELYLQENYRRQGIGKQALEFAEQVCRAQGIQALHLEVDRQNTRAQAVYQQAGFVDHDRYLLTKTWSAV